MYTDLEYDFNICDIHISTYISVYLYREMSKNSTLAQLQIDEVHLSSQPGGKALVGAGGV